MPAEGHRHLQEGALPPFRVARGLAGTHAQTVGGRLLRRPRPPVFRRERWDTPDGDFLDLDSAELGVPEDRPLVLLLHGLEGSARRGYAINTYRHLARRGIASVGLNFRSCSGELNRTARFYHSGETGDPLRVLTGLSQRYPGRRLGAVGFSLGGNALLKLLGEAEGGGSRLVRAAVAVSVPYDLAAGAAVLEQSAMGRFYSRHFIASLRRKAQAKGEMLRGICDPARVRRARTFRAFDDAVTAPVHGFADAADYYARSSAANFVAAIRVPTLLLHAADDPFLPARFLPIAGIAANRALWLVVTERGGHVGFIAGSPWAPRFWAERTAADFLADRLLA